jgi:hypothetical protein
MLYQLSHSCFCCCKGSVAIEYEDLGGSVDWTGMGVIHFAGRLRVHGHQMLLMVYIEIHGGMQY